MHWTPGRISASSLHGCPNESNSPAFMKHGRPDQGTNRVPSYHDVMIEELGDSGRGESSAAKLNPTKQQQLRADPSARSSSNPIPALIAELAALLPWLQHHNLKQPGPLSSLGPPYAGQLKEFCKNLGVAMPGNAGRGGLSGIESQQTVLQMERRLFQAYQEAVQQGLPVLRQDCQQCTTSTCTKWVMRRLGNTWRNLSGPVRIRGACNYHAKAKGEWRDWMGDMPLYMCAPEP